MKSFIKIIIFVFALFFGLFSDSLLPSVIKSNWLLENLKIREAKADTEILKPTTHTDSATTSDPQNAYDSSGVTFSTTRYNTTNDPSITFHTWQTTAHTYTNTYLKVRYHADAATDDTYAISYSTTGCSGSFMDLVSPTSAGATDTTVSSIDLGASPDLAQFCLKIYTVKKKGPDNKDVYIRDIWTEGTYTSVLTPVITSASSNGQIGSEITINGSDFGVASGMATINTVSVLTINSWSDTEIKVLVPGQEGVANITGKIQVTRSSDGAVSNLYPADPANFTILAPTATGSNPTLAITGQSAVAINFFGSGIDTDAGTSPSLKLVKSGETDIVGTGYLKITDYQTAQATFDLTGAATGYWKLVITNMDTQSGSFGDEATTGFYIGAPAPTVSGINPGFGVNSGIASSSSITGNNFQNGATAKLTRTAQSDIVPSTVFTFTDSTTLSNGAFDLTGEALGWWNVVVTNPDLQSGSYGNETDSGFEIRSAAPSNPNNVYQFKNSSDTAEPPVTNIAIGDGVGEQTAIYFRTDMQGGLTGESYYPQVEIKPVGGAFECNNSSPSPCVVTGGFFAEGDGVVYDSTPVQGWVNIDGIDGELYHWQARTRNSSGTSDWVSFGGNNDPNDLDVYLDNTGPAISPGTDGTCDTAITEITDLDVTVRWDTSDTTSGSEPPPGLGAYATAQIQYIKTSDFVDWTSTPGTLSAENSRENSSHYVTVSGLPPGAEYTYRMTSKDAVNNIGTSGNCVFATESSRPIKTIELFILQEAGQNTGTRISKDFSIYIPESPSADISVKSAFIEVSGISSAVANQTVNIELRRGSGQSYVLLGADYTIDSTGTTTLFTILFDALDPLGSGQENMSNITTGATDYGYTLFLNGTATPISAFSAKLVLTYSYVL